MSILTVYILLAIMALSIIGLFWLVLWVTKAPIMEYHCPHCGIVDRHDKDGNCERCGLPVELYDRGQR
jgi:uncharacterized paraquat-inducible protein A